MDNSNKRFKADLIVGICAVIILLLGGSNLDPNFPPTYYFIGVLLFAGAAIYLIHKVFYKDLVVNRADLPAKEMTEIEYIKQMADDIHIIKMILIAFAVIAGLSMLITLFSIINLISKMG